MKIKRCLQRKFLKVTLEFRAFHEHSEMVCKVTPKCIFFRGLAVVLAEFPKDHEIKIAKKERTKVRMLKIYSLSKFEVYNTVLLTAVTMLYIRTPGLICLITGSFDSLTNSSPFPPPPAPNNPQVLH